MNTLLWLNVDQAAERAGRHAVTIRRALQAGELHGSQRTKNGRWRVHVDCLDAWVGGTTCAHQAAGAA